MRWAPASGRGSSNLGSWDPAVHGAAASRSYVSAPLVPSRSALRRGHSRCGGQPIPGLSLARLKHASGRAQMPAREAAGWRGIRRLDPQRVPVPGIVAVTEEEKLGLSIPNPLEGGVAPRRASVARAKTGRSCRPGQDCTETDEPNQSVDEAASNPCRSALRNALLPGGLPLLQAHAERYLPTGRAPRGVGAPRAERRNDGLRSVQRGVLCA